jgi:hypothetical protein
MVSSRFYRPKMAELTSKEKVFVGLAEDAGLNYFIPVDMSTRRVVDSSSVPDGSRITYSFSNAVRKNTFARKSGKGSGEYGVSGISFRILYEFLCESFNSGEYFIDTYFDKIFDTRSSYDRLNQLNEEISGDIEDEVAQLEGELVRKMDGGLDMRFASSKRYSSLKVWKNPMRKKACADIAEEIRYDIINCLATGRIPLRRGRVSAATIKKRNEMLGLGGDRFFYASGQLIEHLKIFVELSEET